MTAALDILRSLGACDDARAWVAVQPDQSPAVLWATCPRGDWMAWYLGRLGVRAGQGSPEHRRAVLVACLCARTALPYAGQWREEIDHLLGRVEAWAHGEAVDLAPVRERLWAIRPAYAYAAAADAAAAAYAAYAAADAAAYAAYAAADAAAYAADAAYAAYAAYAVRYETRVRYLATLADLIRAAVPEAS